MIKEIDYRIDEFDIDSVISEVTLKREIEKIIKDKIHQRIAEKIEQAIFQKVQQTQPLIDAITANNVTSIMMKFDKIINDL